MASITFMLVLFATLPRAGSGQIGGMVSSGPPPQPQSKPEDLCTVEGVVLKSTTGEPVKKVSIWLYPAGGRRQEQYSALTDTAGRFVFQDVEPGRYVLAGGGNGYPQETYGQRTSRGRGKILTFERGSHTKDVVFRLLPGGVITGAVYDEDGDPVVGANVQAVRSSGSNMRGPSGGAQTNDRGEYRIYGLESGQYFLVADDQSRNNDTSDEVYPPTYYPGTTDSAQATTVQVRAGDETGAIDLALRRVHGVHVRGHVVNEFSAKPQGMYVQLVPASPKDGIYPRPFGSPAQDEHGNFDIRGVSPGSYVLLSFWNDEKRTYSGQVPLEVSNTDIDGVTLVLSAPMDLPGRIRTDPGTQLDFTRLNIWLQPRGLQMHGVAAAEVKSDGTFLIRNVFDGNYRILVGGHPEEYYLRSAKLGGSDVLTSGLTISHTQSPGTLDLELTLNGGSVSGAVMHEGNPVPNALVALIPDPPNRDRFEMYSTKLTDELGRFTMLGLPPGDFKLYAWEDPQGADVRDPDFLKTFEKRGTVVHVQEKQRQNVQLDVIPADEEEQ